MFCSKSCNGSTASSFHPFGLIQGASGRVQGALSSRIKFDGPTHGRKSEVASSVVSHLWISSREVAASLWAWKFYGPKWWRTLEPRYSWREPMCANRWLELQTGNSIIMWSLGLQSRRTTWFRDGAWYIRSAFQTPFEWYTSLPDRLRTHKVSIQHTEKSLDLWKDPH